MLAPAGTVLPLSPEWIKRAIQCMKPELKFTQDFMYWLFEDMVKKDETSRKIVNDMAEEAYLSFQCFKFQLTINPRALSDQELKSISVPALYLVGENEKIYSPTAAVERLNRVSPQIKSVGRFGFGDCDPAVEGIHEMGSDCKCICLADWLFCYE
jgi:hypothetical protein